MWGCILEGWIPEGRLAELQSRLEQEVGDQVLVEILPVQPAEKETVPVAFDNPLYARPFEPLVGLLSLPKYGGIDPTPLMAIFMPIFFGLMLGDVAYGAILLGIMLFIRQRYRYNDTLRSLAEVLAIGSA